ncbi:MAG: hypothetical protein ACFFBP_15275 [Promethearchaeota archaeon]
MVRQKLSFKIIQDLAIKVGLKKSGIPGKLLTTQEEFERLSKDHPISLTKLLWWCGKEDHDPWFARPTNIQQEFWCKYCAGKLLYKDLVELAKKVGIDKVGIFGMLNSTQKEFNNRSSNQKPSIIKFLWWCGKKDHKPWPSTAKNIKEGHWCPYCAGKYPLQYKELVELARIRGLEKTGIPGKLITTKEEFKILSAKRKPSDIKLLWWCSKEEHDPWNTTERSIQQGGWCPSCAGNAPHTYDDYVKLARIRGQEKNNIPGKLLTTQDEFEKLIQFNSPSKCKLKWWCGKEEHNPWLTQASSIQLKSWCPECSQGKYQRICKFYFEKIFKKKFPTTMIRNIINDYKGMMHFDGFAKFKINKKWIKLALEYNGKQHYEFPNQYHKKHCEFLDQKRRDNLKRSLCNEHNIFLIIFPYSVDPKMKNPVKIQNYIIKKFEKMTGIKLFDIPQYNHHDYI